MVTLKDIAEEVGVSITTVSSAINNSRPVADETRENILKVAEELGYKANSVAKSLQSGKTRKIVYVVPSVTNLVFAQFIHEIQHALTNNGYDLILLNNEARKDLTQSYTDIIKKSNIDGLLMTQTGTCGKILSDICKQRHLPFVVVLAPDIFEDVNVILSDEEQGTKEAVSHLIKNGHKEIGFVMVKDSALHEKRLSGYKKALELNNIEFNPENLILCNHHEEIDAYVHVKEYLMNKELKVTSFICCNDFMAHGTMQVLKENQIKIPEEISIIGYDDSIGKYLTPSLSSISIPITQMAKTTVKIILRKINKESQESKRIVFPQNLIIRDSVYKL